MRVCNPHLNNGTLELINYACSGSGQAYSDTSIKFWSGSRKYTDLMGPVAPVRGTIPFLNGNPAHLKVANKLFERYRRYQAKIPADGCGRMRLGFELSPALVQVDSLRSKRERFPATGKLIHRHPQHPSVELTCRFDRGDS